MKAEIKQLMLEGWTPVTVVLSAKNYICSAARARNSLDLRSTDSLSGSSLTTQAKQVHDQAC